jgi:hypothetical protein
MLVLLSYELFYNKDVDPKTDSSISNKQDSYLLKEIEFKSDKNDYMRFLFLITFLAHLA